MWWKPRLRCHDDMAHVRMRHVVNHTASVTVEEPRAPVDASHACRSRHGESILGVADDVIELSSSSSRS